MRQSKRRKEQPPIPRVQDDKVDALRKHGTLNPRPDSVRDEKFRGDQEFFDPRDLVQVKYEMLRRVDQGEQTISEASESFGLSRPSFYKAQQDYQQEGLAGLLPRKRGPQGGHKLTVEVMAFLEGLLRDNPRLDAEALARRVEDRFGRSVHPRSVERALARWSKKTP